MKKFTLLFCLLVSGIMATSYAQTNNTPENNDWTQDYNRWTIEAMAGVNRPLTPFTDGYYSTNPGKMIHIGMFRHFSLGTRYMLTNIFGVSVNFSYDGFQEPKDSKSLPFKTTQYMFQLQGVANVGQLLNFPTFTKRLGLLAHFGGQLARFNVDEGVNEGNWERDGGFIMGLTPQFKLSKRINIMADAGYELNIKQHYNWDGAAHSQTNLVGSKVTLSIGLSVSLGKHEQHVDWYVESENVVPKDLYAELEARVKKLENEKVDLKPLEDALAEADQEIVVLNDRIDNLPKPEMGQSGVMQESGYNVFFDFNSSVVSSAYLDVIVSAIETLKNNPGANVVIEGYTDIRGTENWNSRLSKQRAKAVAEMLIQGGVAANRIKTKGLGVDKKFDPQAAENWMLNRRATIIIE